VDVEIDLRGPSPTARLVNADDLKSFAVVLLEDDTPLGERLAPLGVARFDEYAWIATAELERLAGDAATPEWKASFQAMLEFARSKGWVDDELGAVRGHVVRR
jgi:hypothetical protein